MEQYYMGGEHESHPKMSEQQYAHVPMHQMNSMQQMTTDPMQNMDSMHHMQKMDPMHQMQKIDTNTMPHMNMNMNPMHHMNMNSMHHMPGYHKYNGSTFNMNFKDILKRAVKYLVEGLAVAFVAYYFVGKNKLSIRDVVMLGITAAFVFAILDTFSPTVSLGVRFGAGFGIGQSLFGLAPGMMTPPILTPAI